MCDVDEAGRPLRYGVDRSGDGRVDVVLDEECDPPDVEPDRLGG